MQRQREFMQCPDPAGHDVVERALDVFGNRVMPGCPAPKGADLLKE
jgi:hypothetical protein